MALWRGVVAALRLWGTALRRSVRLSSGSRARLSGARQGLAAVAGRGTRHTARLSGVAAATLRRHTARLSSGSWARLCGGDAAIAETVCDGIVN